jgi:hypothetical protein
VANQLILQIEFESYYYSNLKWGYDLSYWNQVKHLFNPINFCEKISTDSHIDNDVIISFKYSDFKISFANNENNIKNIIENIHTVVDQTEPGIFEYTPFIINIKQKNNLLDQYKKMNNIDLILKNQSFIFN